MHETAPSGLQFRRAIRDDIGALLALLDADPISSARGGHSRQISPAVEAAFDWIERSPDNMLIVAELADEIVGMAQLTLIPGLSRNGMTRALIESVHVRADRRLAVSARR